MAEACECMAGAGQAGHSLMPRLQASLRQPGHRAPGPSDQTGAISAPLLAPAKASSIARPSGSAGLIENFESIVVLPMQRGRFLGAGAPHVSVIFVFSYENGGGASPRTCVA